MSYRYFDDEKFDKPFEKVKIKKPYEDAWDALVESHAVAANNDIQEAHADSRNIMHQLLGVC